MLQKRGLLRRELSAEDTVFIDIQGLVLDICIDVSEVEYIYSSIGLVIDKI